MVESWETFEALVYYSRERLTGKGWLFVERGFINFRIDCEMVQNSQDLQLTSRAAFHHCQRSMSGAWTSYTSAMSSQTLAKTFSKSSAIVFKSILSVLSLSYGAIRWALLRAFSSRQGSFAEMLSWRSRQTEVGGDMGIEGEKSQQSSLKSCAR